MNRKISILTITLILTIIVFVISTYMQKKIINYEPTIKCLVLKDSIKAGEKLSEEKFHLAELPISLLGTIPVLQDFAEIEGLYSKDDIYKGQIAIKSQFATKENLSIFEAEERKRKNIY